MPGIDANNLPLWLAVALFLINLFREQLGILVPQAVKHVADRKTDRQEHEQDIEQALINSRLQSSANDDLRISRLEGQLIEALHRKDSFIEKQLDQRLSDQQDLLKKLLDQSSLIRSNGTRTNDLLTAMNGSLTKLNDVLTVVAVSPGKLNYVHGYVDVDNDDAKPDAKPST